MFGPCATSSLTLSLGNRASQLQCHVVCGSDPIKGQATQASGVLMWGHEPGSLPGQGKSTPTPPGTRLWPSARVGNPSAKCPHVGARAGSCPGQGQANLNATWRTGLTQRKGRSAQAPRQVSQSTRVGQPNRQVSSCGGVGPSDTQAAPLKLEVIIFFPSIPSMSNAF